MTITPDMLAASYTDESTDPQTEIESLAELAAEYGYRLVPVDSPESSDGIIPAANPATPEDTVRRLTWLQAAIKSAKATAKAHEAERDRLDPELQESWAEVGRTSDTIDGYTAFITPSTSYVKNDPDTATGEIIKVLMDLGLGHMVKETFSYQSLLALLKEMDAQGMPMPDPLAELITFKKGYKIGITPAGRKRGGPRTAA